MGEENRSEAIRRLLDDDPAMKPAQAKAILVGRGITISSALFRIVRAAWRSERAQALEWAEQSRKEQEERRRKAEEDLRELSVSIMAEMSEEMSEMDRSLLECIYRGLAERLPAALATKENWDRLLSDFISGDFGRM
jgi:hypothetical protein